MLDVTSATKFEQFEIHEGLYIISQKGDRHNVIGYVNLHPYAGGWFWFIGTVMSTLYMRKEEAIEGLIQSFIIEKMNGVSKKLGIFDDEELTKGR